MPYQPFSLLANLAKAETVTAERTDGKVSFIDAMQQMAISSVFDILRRSKPDFVRELYTLSAADGELAYENARCYATQIVRLYRNQLISSGRTQTLTRRTGIRSLVDIGPSFPTLFKENWDLFCKVGAIEAKDSPVAYLTSLYRFALEQLEGSTAETNRIKLDERRPDLKDLLIDQNSTFTPIPMLHIVNDVLSKAISAYVDTIPEDKDKTIYQLIAARHHPFQFPYNFHYQQVTLGLSGKKPVLGELSYQVSLEVPATAGQSNAYGLVQQPASVAQAMLSGLGPEQQQLLLEGPLPATEDEQPDPLIVSFFKFKYGSTYAGSANNPLNSLTLFLEKTGLTTAQVEALLAVRNHVPYKTPNALAEGDTATGPVKYGACYVNGPSTTAAMGIIKGADNKLHLSNTNADRFDRLQRMIRLQRWLDIPFAQLDTLIMAAILSESPANAGRVLNTHTLRVLGTYRYLHKHYSIEAEEFAAFIYRLPVYASAPRVPMFDKAFNSPAVFDTPLMLDAQVFYPVSATNGGEKTLAQLCAALQLQPTEESLWLLVNDTAELDDDAQESLKRNVNTMSALYRQIRIASLFGLTARDSWALVDLLGGEGYRKQVVTATLAPAAVADAPPDILDILLQMDWVVTWLKDTGRDIATVRRQLAVDNPENPIPVELLEQLNQLGKDAREATLSEAQLAPLNLPPGVEWWQVILAPLIEANGLVKAQPLTLVDNLPAALALKIHEQLETVGLPNPIKETVATALLDFVLKGYYAQHRLVEGLLQSTAGLPLDRGETVLRWAGSSADRFLSQVLTATDETELTLPLNASGTLLLDALQRLLRHAEVNQQLGLSAQALRTFLVHPQWLHGAFVAALPLSFSSLYLLDRYRDWRDQAGEPEAVLLSYFSRANGLETTEKTTTPGPCAALLATLTSWPASEVLAATTAPTIPNGVAATMQQVDWVRRMQSASQRTGLAAAQLLGATDLTITSTAAQWQAVGEAVVAASR